MAITLDGTTGITAPGVTDTGNLSVSGTSTLTGSIGNVTAGTISSGAITSSGLVTGATGALYPVVRPGASKTASGSSVDFTAIPSWVNRITVQINGLSYAAAGVGVVRIGSGSLSTTGYTSNVVVSNSTSVSTSAQTDGFGSISTAAAATTVNGVYVITHLGANTWSFSEQVFRTTDNTGMAGSGFIALGGVLDQLSLVATTSTFDAGTINILYE